jgi:two-component system sensor histidine kinase PhoQ
VTRRSPSLSRRLLLTALVLLPLSLGATGTYLERAHREALDAAISERLQLQVVTLLALADVGENFELPLMPLESRLLQPGSGLYAMVSEGPGEPLWISPSTALLPNALQQLSDGIPALAVGARHDSERNGLLRHAYQVRWELDSGEQKLLRFVVARAQRRGTWM